VIFAVNPLSLIRFTDPCEAVLPHPEGTGHRVADGHAYVESFNGMLRAEYLDGPRALGERTPNEFARQIAASRDLSCSTIAGD
jgi:hypothetical protein